MQDAKNRHFCTIAQLCRAVSSQLRHVSTIGKNVKQRYLHVSHNMVNFGLLTAEICWRVRGPLQISMGLASLIDSVTARHSSSGRQPNFAVLNRWRHLYSAGRPSHWALAHISSLLLLLFYIIFASHSENKTPRKNLSLQEYWNLVARHKDRWQ